LKHDDRIDAAAPHVVEVRVDDETLSVDLSDSRTIAVPVAWYPRLHHATPPSKGTGA
jgi:hypothetical protein